MRNVRSILLFLIPLMAIMAPGVFALAATDHGDPSPSGGFNIVGECVRRYAGRGGELIEGPARGTAHFARLGRDLRGADLLVIEQCWTHDWRNRAEGLDPNGGCSWLSTLQRVRLNVSLNDTPLYQSTLTPTPPAGGELSPFDGTVDFDGTSGDTVLTDAVITGGEIQFVMTDALRAALSDPAGFDVTVESSGSSLESTVGPVFGDTQFRWGGGLVFRAVDLDAPAP